MEHYGKVQGWFDFPEIYQRIAVLVKDGDTIVEVGSWLGKSAIYMANELKKNNKDVRFFCIDIWEGITGDDIVDGIMKANGGSVMDIFTSNVQLCGMSDVINPIKMDSVKSSDQFVDGSVAFCFIDALHTYEAVKNDVKAWLPKIKKGGYIGGHDADRPCVQKALNEVLGNKWYSESPRSWLYHKN